MLNELHPQALRIADALKARREKIAVADGATGGLIGAALLTVPGALKFYVGGGQPASGPTGRSGSGLPPERTWRRSRR